MAGQFSRQGLRILQGGVRVDLELRHNTALDNFFQGSLPVGGLPDNGGSLVQCEKRGVLPDMIIISPSRTRAASLGLRAM